MTCERRKGQQSRYFAALCMTDFLCLFEETRHEKVFVVLLLAAVVQKSSENTERLVTATVRVVFTGSKPLPLSSHALERR